MLLVLLGVLWIVAKYPYCVQAEGYERWQTVAEEERDNAGLLKNSRAQQNAKAWKKINGICYNGSGEEIPGAITRGIDVSEWQDTIDWGKVKNSDVDFAFIRVSYGRNYLDKKYTYNMTQTNAAGLPVGVYIYSLAVTPQEALKEAQFVIEKLKGYKVSYPVVFDLEYSGIQNLSKAQVGELALAFCNEIKKAGYYPMIYTNTYWYSSEVDWSKISDVDVWLARYGDTIQAPSHSAYNYSIWQSTDGDGGGTLYSTKGLIDGIPVYNNIDVNFGFVDYTKKIIPRTGPVASYTPSSQPNLTVGLSISTDTSVKNGWVTENGKTYYYVNGTKVTGWKKIDGKYYYFNSTNGYIYKNVLLTSSKNNICYIDSTGARVTNQWVTWKEKRYYMGASGYALKGWQSIDGRYYYFNSVKGYAYKNVLLTSSKNNICYIDSTGARVISQWVNWKDNKYYMSSSGYAVKGMKKISGKYYYFDGNGKMCYGWQVINGKKYYFYKGSGKRAQSVTLTSSTGVVSVFDAQGVCIKQYRN